MSYEMNGGSMTVATSIAHTTDGYLGRAFIAGTEVYETDQVFDEPQDAADAVRRVVLGAFAKLFNG